MKNCDFGNCRHTERTKFLKFSETASFSFYIAISEQSLVAERALIPYGHPAAEISILKS